MVEQAYFDTSVVAPLYRGEPMTATAEALQQNYRPVISLLTEVELTSTIARWVRTGELTEEQALLVDKTFAEDLPLNVFERAQLQDRHYWHVRTWLQQRTTNLRTLDALHLAIAAEKRLAHDHSRQQAPTSRDESRLYVTPGPCWQRRRITRPLSHTTKRRDELMRDSII